MASEPTTIPEPMRLILRLAEDAQNEMQGHLMDEGHRRAFAAISVIAQHELGDAAMPSR